MPVRIWQGLSDNIVPPAIAQQLATVLPHSESRYLPDEGHLSLVARHLGVVSSSPSSALRERSAPMAEVREQQAAFEARDLETIELEVDQDGSPVAIEPRGWFVCIVPGLVKQWWHPFVHERHKHVFAMRPVGPGQWTLFEPWWHRLLTATITSEQARKFLIWSARGDVLHVREAVLHQLRPGPRPRLGATGCAAAWHAIRRRRQILKPSRCARGCPTRRASEHSCRS